MGQSSGQNTSYAAASAATPAMNALSNSAQGIAANELGNMQTYNENPMAINQQMGNEAYIAKQAANNYLNTYAPGVLQAQNAITTQLGQRASGQMNPIVQQQLANAGVMNSLASGQKINNQGLGMTVAANTMGQGLNNYQLQNLAAAQGMVNQYQAPAMALDPTGYAQLNYQQGANQVGLQNQQNQSLANIINQGVNNTNNQWQQQVGAMGQVASNNIAAQNQNNAANMSFFGNLLSSGAGIGLAAAA